MGVKYLNKSKQKEKRYIQLLVVLLLVLTPSITAKPVSARKQYIYRNVNVRYGEYSYFDFTVYGDDVPLQLTLDASAYGINYFVVDKVNYDKARTYLNSVNLTQVSLDTVPFDYIIGDQIISLTTKFFTNNADVYYLLLVNNLGNLSTIYVLLEGEDPSPVILSLMVVSIVLLVFIMIGRNQNIARFQKRVRSRDQKRYS